MSDNPLETRKLGYLYALGQVGIEMVAPLVVGLFADYYLGISPWLAVFGAVVGFAGGLVHLIWMLKYFDKLKRATKSQPPQPHEKP